MYKARLRRSGQQVAVKVQRPGVREAIALDVFIMRFLAGKLRKWRQLNSDLPGLLDEWAASLFRELDYRREAANGTRFKELYAHLEVSVMPSWTIEGRTSHVSVTMGCFHLGMNQPHRSIATQTHTALTLGNFCKPWQLIGVGENGSFVPLP